ncbi:DUF411 domain-containing protein [Novilysobacter defluvii]|nr:DUF411 domain-containing protein [Lysobacter defluvii]
MKLRFAARSVGFALAIAALAACAQETVPHQVAATPEAGVAAAQDVDQAPADADGLPVMMVHRSPSCGCCGAWVDHVREAGFPVEVHEMDDLGEVKERLGIPYGKGSCHTAEVGGYAIEGHVPASDIKRLLEEKPDALGLVLPGMPMGSPGMEMPDGRSRPFTVELVKRDGTTEPFASH